MIRVGYSQNLNGFEKPALTSGNFVPLPVVKDYTKDADAVIIPGEINAKAIKNLPGTHGRQDPLEGSGSI